MGAESKRVVGKLDEFVTNLVKKITIGVTNEIVDKNPVLTGFSQSNWIPKIGSPVETPAGSKTGVNRSPQEQGLADVAVRYKLPEEVYISNPVDYITKLNEGSSAKAPSGFVQIAIAKAIRTVL